MLAHHRSPKIAVTTIARSMNTTIFFLHNISPSQSLSPEAEKTLRFLNFLTRVHSISPPTFWEIDDRSTVASSVFQNYVFVRPATGDVQGRPHWSLILSALCIHRGVKVSYSSGCTKASSSTRASVYGTGIRRIVSSEELHSSYLILESERSL